jgi:hypothetical protein
MDKDRQMTVEVANLTVLTLECDLRTNVSNPFRKNRQLHLWHPLPLPKSLQKITPPRSGNPKKRLIRFPRRYHFTGGGSGVLWLHSIEPTSTLGSGYLDFVVLMLSETSSCAGFQTPQVVSHFTLRGFRQQVLRLGLAAMNHQFHCLARTNFFSAIERASIIK